MFCFWLIIIHHGVVGVTLSFSFPIRMENLKELRGTR